MKYTWLVMLLALQGTMSVARASDACSQAFADEAFQNPLPMVGRNVFDVQARARAALRGTGFEKHSGLYSCVIPNGRSYCVESQMDLWRLYGAVNGTFSAKISSELIRLQPEQLQTTFPIDRVHFYINPKTWAFTASFRNDDQNSGMYHTVYTDNGKCVPADEMKITEDFEAQLRADLLNSLLGDTSKTGSLPYNYALDAQGNWFQIFGVYPDDGQVDLLNLGLEQHLLKQTDVLAAMTVFSSVSVFATLQEASPVSAKFLTGESARSWSCIQGVNSLNNPYREKRAVIYRGFTNIEFARMVTSEAERKSNEVTIRARVLRTGWIGEYHPALLLNGMQESTLATVPNDLTSFMVDMNPKTDLVQIHGMNAAQANTRFGIPYPMIAFGDMVCFLR